MGGNPAEDVSIRHNYVYLTFSSGDRGLRWTTKSPGANLRSQHGVLPVSILDDVDEQGSIEWSMAQWMRV